MFVGCKIPEERDGELQESKTAGSGGKKKRQRSGSGPPSRQGELAAGKAWHRRRRPELVIPRPGMDGCLISRAVTPASWEFA